MSDSTYGGTIPPRTDVGPGPVPTTSTTEAPRPVDTGLAFTGFDLIGTLVIALALMLAGWAALRASRVKPLPGDDLVIPAYGGTSPEVSDGTWA